MKTKRLWLVVLLVSAVVLALGITSTVIDAVNIKGTVTNIVSVLSSYLGTEKRICCGNEHDQQRPAIAYNRSRSEYMVVSYQTLNAGGSIGGARLGLDGYAFSHFLLSPINTYECCLHPDVAYNRTNDEYLVVWQQYNTSQNKWEIYGRIIPWDGTDFSVAPFPIAQWSSMNLLYPKVAWNSFRNEYMVVWHTENAASNLLLGIGRRRLSANGAFLSNADYVTSSNSPGLPDIAYNPAPDQYVVVWAQAGSSSIDIYGGKLSWQGILQGSVFPIGAGANEQQFPAITTNEQNRYLVVWQDDQIVAGDWDINGQFLDASANLVGGNIWFDASTALETHPAVSVNGVTQEYFVVYQKTTPSGESIWGNFIDGNGANLDWFEVSPGGFGDNRHPAVSTYLAGYYVAYEWKSWEPNSISDLYGRMWSPNVVYLPMALR